MKRAWALPLVPLYWAGLSVKGALAPQPKRLAWPVVSVGSLSAGGAGKTPVVKALAGVLGQMGVRVDVLSRGYGRSSKAVERVHADGDARRFGDEPMELARAGVEVFVGADRYAAGLVAEARGGQGAHLLDDGFQHRRLARDLDVVLLTAQDVGDSLLPAGDLREPLRALERADVIVLREEEAAELRGWLAARGLRAEVWVVRRRLSLPVDMPSRPVAFCGIARPEGFFAGLVAAGFAPRVRIAFADHQQYGIAEIERLAEAAKLLRADGFVTTAKDEVKLTGPLRALLETAGPIRAAELRVEMVDEAAVRRQLEELVKPPVL